MRGNFNYTGFTAGDLTKSKQTLASAGTAVKEGLAVAISVWQGSPTAEQSTHYKKWFGAVTAVRSNRVKQVLWAINRAWDIAGQNLTIRYNTAGTCAAGDFAVANAPPLGWHNGAISSSAQFREANTLHFCKKFLDSGMSFDGLNTIAHELSHVYGGTDDVAHPTQVGQLAYGVDACTALATGNPAQAVENADNYGYFVAYWFYRRTLSSTLSEV